MTKKAKTKSRDLAADLKESVEFKFDPKLYNNPGFCQCGCKGKTASRFVPGHDARHKSNLIKTALDESLPASQRKAAEDELRWRSWTHFLEKKRHLVKVAAAKEATRKPGRTRQQLPHGVTAEQYAEAERQCIERGIVHEKLTAGEVRGILAGEFFDRDYLPGASILRFPTVRELEEEAK